MGRWNEFKSASIDCSEDEEKRNFDSRSHDSSGFGCWIPNLRDALVGDIERKGFEPRLAKDHMGEKAI